jgi:hypothetical protein
VCMHCFDCSLISTFTNETQVSSPVTLTWLWNSLPSLCYFSKKVKAKAILCVLCTPISILGPPLVSLLCRGGACMPKWTWGPCRQ